MVATLPASPGGSMTAGDPTKVMGRRVLAALIDAALVLVPTVALFLSQVEYLEVSSLDRPPDVYCEDYMDQVDGFCMDLSDVDDRVYITDGYAPEASLALWGISLGMLVVVQGLTGWTLGKLVTGIRTVREDGRTPGIPRAFLRWLLGLVDAFPYVIPLVGLITAGTSQGHRRVGDLAARTYVVRSRAAGHPIRVPSGIDPLLGTEIPSGEWPPASTWAPPPPSTTAGGWASPAAGAPSAWPEAQPTGDLTPPGATVPPADPGARTPPEVTDEPTSAEEAPADAAEDGGEPWMAADADWTAAEPATAPPSPEPAHPEERAAGTDVAAPGEEAPPAEPAPEVGPATELPDVAAEAAPDAAPPLASRPFEAVEEPAMPPPQWDEARGTYIQWDPRRAKWLQWDEQSRTWFLIPGQ